SFLILRILFGTALIYASMYAKFLHSDLALDTVNDYHLTQFFPFTPLFLVLGAFLIETLIGLAFMLGFAIRFFALFFLTFLTMSILFFGESVWPHAILFGVAIVLFFHGYDKFTVWGRNGKNEPVL
ncbi:MAG TPA: DoxX family membrane protein, partial [Candidatus Andersenbacteria bacterium]|nr:DoxX family membrane protein [Candidatus Andersenbacteria bacterium]